MKETFAHPVDEDQILNFSIELFVSIHVISFKKGFFPLILEQPVANISNQL